MKPGLIVQKYRKQIKRSAILRGVERWGISPPMGGPWLPRRGRDQLKCWGNATQPPCWGVSGLHSQPDGRWGCRKDGRPGTQDPSQSPRHPRPEARAAASLPISSQAARVLTCFPVTGGQTPQQGAGGRLASDRLASGHAYIHSYLKHSGPYHLWAHRAQCYPSNNSPKCSIS